MTLITSHSPILSRIACTGLPKPFQYLIAEYTIARFEIDEFQLWDKAKRDSTWEQIDKWKAPPSIEVALDFGIVRAAIMITLVRSDHDPFQSIVVSRTEEGIQGVMIYDTSQSTQWKIAQILSARKFPGAGKALVQHLIDRATNHPTQVQAIAVTSLDTAISFYGSFDFTPLPNCTLSLTRSIVWHQ